MAATEHCCSFEWHIYNPFLPCQQLETTFWHGSPEVLPWKVTLEHMGSRIHWRKFSVSLQLLQLQSLVADKVEVYICMNGATITEKKLPKFLFGIANWSKCYFECNAEMRPREEPHHLVVRFVISLPGIATGNEELLAYDHLQMLSINLKSLLLKEQMHKNMKLRSTDPDRSFDVHSYIIAERWNNFFEKHEIDADNQRAMENVETNISPALLKEILIYLYSGKLGECWSYWVKEEYMTELSRVIKLYGLAQLDRALRKSDLKHCQTTRSDGLIESRIFPLEIVNERAVSTVWSTWRVSLNPEYDSFFETRLQIKDGNWLSYSLQSKSASRLYVQLNLELEVKGAGSEKIFHLHEQVHTIEPKATVESRPVLFLGCPETFGSTSSDGTGSEFSVRCFLNVTEGRRVHQAWSESAEILEREREMLTVFSDHMQILREKKFHTDMTVVSHPTRFPNDTVIFDRIHKGILAARVPQWWNGLQDVEPMSPVPDVATSTLSSETLPSVLDYIYTGKVFTIPFPSLREVREFAENTSFLTLNDLAVPPPDLV